MSSLYLELELLSPVAITAHSATVGGHESLTWIPGGQLLGATAAALDRDPDGALPDEVWRILFSGEVRFGDAWPEADGQPAPPAPLSLHVPKGSDGPIYNLVHADRTGKGQLEQVRDRHVSSGGRSVRPARHHTLRTAVEEQGRAREGFLFGIEALDAGQRFFARVDADDPQLLARVRGCLDGRQIAVGRSRSAEFGQVAVRCRDPWDEPEEASASGQLLLWVIADLALRDPLTGAPRLHLQPADLGLPEGWQLVPEKTFVRTRRYSPFNGRRLRPDLERQVVRPGSVFVLSGSELPPDSLARLRERLRRGIGEHIQEGLGRMVMDPKILAGPQLGLVLPAPVPAPQQAAMPNDGLGQWLGARLEALAEATGAERAARVLAEEMGRNRIGRSQWGEIRRMAREARFRPDGQRWLLAQIEAFLGHGARLHTWPKNARQVLLERVRTVSPEVIERASALLARPEQEARR